MSNIWHIQSLYTEEEITNKIEEIINSLCGEFTGLSATVRNTKDKAYFQCLEMDFRYNTNSFNHSSNKYIINPREIFDLDMFENKLRKMVINEVIRGV